MRESAKKEEIVTAPGPDTIPGDGGKPVTLEIKVLHNATIQKIKDNYTKRSIATDSKGNPYIANGEVAFKVEHDNARASRHILAEALVHPDLKNTELMEYFNCNDISEMPNKVFPNADEYSHVSRAVMIALGLASKPDVEGKDKLLDEAKN